MRRFASLRRSADFARMRRLGRRKASGFLTVYSAGVHESEPRSIVGITVGKPVGNAVARNRVRRRLAAIVHESLEGRRVRLLVIARPGAAEAPFEHLRRDLQRALP